MRRTPALFLSVLVWCAGAAVVLPGVASAGVPMTPPMVTVDAPAAVSAPSVRMSSAVTAKIHHYNICGANRDVCTVDQARTARDVLAFLAVADGAWMISLNEVCIGDFEDLTSRLKVAGTMVITSHSVRGCDGRSFGNAILHPGAVRRDGKAWYLSNSGRDCAALECRAMLCLKFDTYAGPMGQCTAHLAGVRLEGDTDEMVHKKTKHQAAEYIYIATSWMEPGRRFSMAGDFNLVRDDLPEAYDAHVDLVTGATYPIRNDDQVPKTPNRQIDFIFVQHVGTRTLKDPYCPPNASDHCHTSGEWRPLDS